MLRPITVAPMLDEPLLHDRRAFVHLSTFKPKQGAKGREPKRPGVQTLAADPERGLDALIGAGDESVERHR